MSHDTYTASKIFSRSYQSFDSAVETLSASTNIMIQSSRKRFPITLVTMTAVFSFLFVVADGFQFQRGGGVPSTRHELHWLRSTGSEPSSLEEDQNQQQNTPRRGVLRRLLIEAPLKHAAATAALLVPVNPCRALSAEDAATAYDSYAASYNELDGGRAASAFGIDEARSNLIQRAKGDVLEIGVGTGLNLDKYVSSQVSSLTLVDISAGMLREAERQKLTLQNLEGVPVKFIKADATADLVNMFGKQSFDTVVDTFSLCVFGNEGARKSLNEMKQVVKSRGEGGRVLLLENSRSSNPLLGLYQDVTAEQAASMGGKGCLYDQDVGRLIRESGMTVVDEKQYAAGLFRSFVCTHEL